MTAKRYADENDCNCPIAEVSANGRQWIMNNGLICGACGESLSMHHRRKHPHPNFAQLSERTTHNARARACIAFTLERDESFEA